jgi:hypothetical protein
LPPFNPPCKTSSNVLQGGLKGVIIEVDIYSVIRQRHLNEESQSEIAKF